LSSGLKKENKNCPAMGGFSYIEIKNRLDPIFLFDFLAKLTVDNYY